MAFKFNGIDLKNVIFNGVSLGKVIFNGVTVWIKELFIFKEGDTSLSNGCTVTRYQYSGNSYYEFLDGSFNVVANGGGGSYCDARITTFDISDFDKLEIVAKTNTTDGRTLINLYDSTGSTVLAEAIKDEEVTTSFKTFTIDISKYKGNIILHINSTIWSSGAWSIFYIKSIRVY